MNGRRMRKMLATMAAVLAMFFCKVPLFAQGYPVFDNLGLLAAIDRFYQGYDQVMNTLTMIEQNYQSMQQAYERAKSWSFDSPDFNDGSLLKNIDIRDELKDAGTQINRELSNIRQIRDSFTAKNITMNGHSYSLKDLAGLGDSDRSLADLASDTAYMTKDTVREAALKFAQGVTKDEAENIFARYGVSPKNFAMIDPISKMMQKATAAVLAPAEELIEGVYTEQTREEITLANEITKKLLAGSGDDLTVTQATQTLGLLQKLSLDQMRELNRSLRSASAYSAWRDRYIDELETARKNDLRQWQNAQQEDSDMMQEIF